MSILKILFGFSRNQGLVAFTNQGGKKSMSSMRIRTNVHSLIAQRHLENNNGEMGESLEKLSSGYRINKSRDDAAGLAVSETMRGKIRGLNQAKRNSNDAVSMLQVAEGAMNEMSNILVRMRELTVQSATDTLGERDRSFLNKEYVQLAEEIDRIAATTEFNENKFFVSDSNNPKSRYVIQVGTNHSQENTNTETMSINLEGLKFTTADLGLSKGAEIGGLNVGEVGPAREEISKKLENIDSALGRLASERATLGSLQSRLGSTINNLAISTENLNTANSRIRDVDVAEETANLAQKRILIQSNLSVLSQANQMPDLALSLLR
jgi:flagellin